jgi:hypothetical protein
MVLRTMAAESTSTVVWLTQRFSDSPVLARRLTNHSMEMVKPRDYISAAAVTAQLAVVAILDRSTSEIAACCSNAIVHITWYLETQTTHRFAALPAWLAEDMSVYRGDKQAYDLDRNAGGKLARFRSQMYSA